MIHICPDEIAALGFALAALRALRLFWRQNVMPYVARKRAAWKVAA